MKTLELVKIRENIVKNYDNGEAVETINSIEYQVKDQDMVVGSANIGIGTVNLNIYNLNDTTIQDIQAKLESIFAQ